MEERRCIPQIKSQTVEACVCVRKERNLASLASFGNPTLYYDTLFLFPFTEGLLAEFKEVANRFYPCLIDGENNGTYQSNKMFCVPDSIDKTESNSNQTTRRITVVGTGNWVQSAQMNW